MQSPTSDYVRAVPVGIAFDRLLLRGKVFAPTTRVRSPPLERLASDVDARSRDGLKADDSDLGLTTIVGMGWSHDAVVKLRVLWVADQVSWGAVSPGVSVCDGIVGLGHLRPTLSLVMGATSLPVDSA